MRLKMEGKEGVRVIWDGEEVTGKIKGGLGLTTTDAIHK